MEVWLNRELDNFEDYLGRVARNDGDRNSQHYDELHWYNRGKEEKKLRLKAENGRIDDVTLYRYITITQFWQMFSSQKFPLLNPSLWKDPLESPFFNAKIKRGANYVETPFKKRFFAQCFTLNDSSESMWKTYGNGEKLVRLKIKVGAIRRMVEQNQREFGAHSFYLGRVVYLNFEDIKHLFNHGYMFEKTYRDVHRPDQAKTLLVKRYAYAFEKEVRLIFDSQDHFTYAGAIPKVVELNIDRLENLISEVLLDPDLNDHEVDFYKDAWNFLPPTRIKKCRLYNKNDYQLKINPNRN